MTEPRDAIPMAVRYKQQARAAWDAADKAVGSSYGSSEHAARIEAAGRIAAALILADGSKEN